MTVGRLVALGGLFLAWWGFQQDDARAFAWAVAAVVLSPLVRPLLGLNAGASQGEGPDAPPPSPPPSGGAAPVEGHGVMPASRQRFKR